MKILQINSVCDFGSTGRTTRELADFLQENGHECYVAYGHRSSTYPNSFKVGTVLENHVHNAFFTRLLGLQGYGTIRGTRELVRWIEENKPDIIHLRNLHANYLNYPILFKCIIRNKIPVVFTLHDCYNYTGKCTHYTAIKCNKWQTECKNCPQFHQNDVSLFWDHSQKVFDEKKAFYAKIPKMTVVAVSKWLKGEAEKSILAGNGHKVTFIYNWIDHNKFHPASVEQIVSFINKYRLVSSYKYLISVSQSWEKGTSRFKDAARLAMKLPSEYRLLLVGKAAKGVVFPESVIHIPYISNSEELSAAYSFATAYVHLSVEDTFGKVIAEAMSCGTIPMVFDSTACGEIPGPYGIVVPAHDIDSFINRLSEIDDLHRKKDDMLQFVSEKYDYRTNAQKYIKLYEELLKHEKY